MVSNNFSGIELVNPEQLSNAPTNVFAFILFLNKSSGIDVKLGSFFGKLLPSKLVLKILYKVEHKKRG